MNILLAVDSSSCSDEAVAAVCGWYRPQGATVKAIHVIQWPHDLPQQLTFAEGAGAAECVMRVHEQLRSSATALVDSAVSRLCGAGFAAEAVVIEGETRRAIVDLAASWPADVIVLGSHGRRLFNRMLLGSVSEGVVRHAPCSVTVVRARHDGGDD